MKMYGSLQNRLMEGYTPTEITVGMGVTEYHYTDRDAWEVIAVKDQKHITIREMDHTAANEGMTNNWILSSNENNKTIDIVKRGKYWYTYCTLTISDIESLDDFGKLRASLAGFDFDRIKEKGKQTKYSKINISIGHANYYYDYEF